MNCHEFVTVFLLSVVEGVCSFFFVFIGCGSTISWLGQETGPNVLSISLCFGFTSAFLANISTYFGGGFFNPAITIALAANRSISPKRALCFVWAQLIGAVSGAGLLYVIIPEESSVHLRGKIQSVSPWAGFGVELLLTVAVMLTVLMCTEKGHTIVDRAASVVFGQVVAACHLFAYPITGCGINPARVFGPALVEHQWTDHWVYWFGPIFGALLATGIYHVANNFPVTSADELVIIGKELHGKAESAKRPDYQGELPQSCDIQTQTPSELKTTV
ncbi:lens fiber major intrinsic protein-like [Stylophora pistillata]|uniref:lens fiber major intrinsic protein-like n=1 Tax=Stylophora pistillata TaxID=50429 RepID=UPI000C042C25|nr:lens fiber major intrinsic protein-like [Stylophora pistillata]